MDANYIASEEAAADYLYGLAPVEFVAARNQLAKELRSSGHRDLAEQIMSLRRPTVLAGEMNRVLRLEPDLVDTLLAAALALRSGQLHLLAGDAVNVAELQRAHREAAGAVAAQADRDREEIQEAIEAASLDETFHGPLRAAAFAVEPTPQIGFDLLTPHPEATVSSLAEARARKRAAEGDEQPSGWTRAADLAETAGSGPGPERAGQSPTAVLSRLNEEQAATELDEAAKAHHLAERRVDAASKASDKAQERVVAAEKRLAATRGHLAESEAKLADAHHALSRAQERLKTAEKATENSQD